MPTVDPHHGFRFDSESGRRAGLISGRVRRAAAAERAWEGFAEAVLMAEAFDRLAGRFARRFDRFAC